MHHDAHGVLDVEQRQGHNIFISTSAVHDVVTNATLQAVQRHRGIIVECVKDPDVSLRRRALDLVYSLVNKDNICNLTKVRSACLV